MAELFSLGGRKPMLGCALLAVHWTVLLVTGFVVTILAAPLAALLLGALSGLVGGTPDYRSAIFYVMVPLVAIASLWVSRRINRWLDDRLAP